MSCPSGGEHQPQQMTNADGVPITVCNKCWTRLA